MENSLTKRPHNLTLEEKKYMKITGVKDVDSFNEEMIVALLDDSEITIRGNNLHISKLSVDSGELEIDGEITSFAYTDSAPSGGFLKKLLR